MIPGGTAVLLLVALVVVIAGVAALAWAIVRRSARVWAFLAPHVAAFGTRLRSSPILAQVRRRYPRTAAFLADRLSLTGWLGLHLTLGLALSLAALVAFARLADAVLFERELRALDGAAAWIADLLRSPASDRVFEVVTTLGNPLTWAAITAAVIVMLSLRREWMLAIGWVVAIGGGGALDLALKTLFHRPRPTGADAFLAGHTWSFPSGHAMGSLIGYGMLAYLLVVHVHRGAVRVAIATAAIILVVAIGLSRIYLGVHYFTDVAAGYLAGVLWLSACITGLELARRRGASAAVPPARRGTGAPGVTG